MLTPLVFRKQNSDGFKRVHPPLRCSIKAESVTANPAVYSHLSEARSRIRKIQKLERAAETTTGAKTVSTEWMPTDTQTTNSQEPGSSEADAPPLTQQQLFNRAYAEGIRDYQKSHAGNTAKAVLESFLNSEQSKNGAMARDRKRKNTKDDSERNNEPTYWPKSPPMLKRLNYYVHWLSIS